MWMCRKGEILILVLNCRPFKCSEESKPFNCSKQSSIFSSSLANHVLFLCFYNYVSENALLDMCYFLIFGDQYSRNYITQLIHTKPSTIYIYTSCNPRLDHTITSDTRSLYNFLYTLIFPLAHSRSQLAYLQHHSFIHN